MSTILHIMIWVAVFAGLAILAGWLGVTIGLKTARKYPAMAGMLLLFGSFVKLDPPPPPKFERIISGEDAAGDPPET